MQPLLRLDEIGKIYAPGLFKRKVEALRSLSLEVRPGETYGFLGVNGAGKTTTFKILLGLLRPTRGHGMLLGYRLGDPRARARLGFLPELPAYYPHLTAGEILRFGRDLSGVSKDDVADRRRLEELGLAGIWDRPVRKLSKGQQQRLGLAQALAHEPELIVLDEPMSGLDPVGRGLVKRVLRKQRAEGRTLLLSTHVLADVEALADRVGLLADGALRFEGAPAEILADAPHEVVIEGEKELPGDVLEGMSPGSHRTPGQAWSVSLDRPSGAQVDACIRRIVVAGARITKVETRRADLESYFLREFAPASGRDEDEEEVQAWA